jgi:hypothetical protein
MSGLTRTWRVSANCGGAKTVVLTFYLARPTGQKQYYTSLLYFLEYFFTMATPAKMMAMATSSRGPKGSR